MAGLPTVISFYCGDQYYYDCAERLAADCRRLNIPHDIEEIHVPADVDWSQITRVKVPFYERKLKEHDGPVLWVDVDCRMVKVPRMLEGCNLDMMGFAQRFRYIREYDPYDTVRFWVPGVLFFNNTPAMREFVGLMNEIEQSTTERITDDYCLHQAWTTHKSSLNIGFFAPKTVSRTMAKATDDTVWIYGASGNVAEFKGTVLQHEGRDLLSNPRVADKIRALHDTPQIRASVLNDAAVDILKDGDRPTATKIMQQAVRLDPDDSKFTSRYADYLRGLGDREEAFGVLAEYLERHPDDGENRRTLVKFYLMYNHFDRARAELEVLVHHEDPKWSDYVRSARFDLYLEERAAELGLSKAERTGMWWMKTPYPGNFGDALSPYIVEKVTGKPPRLVARNKGVLAIGSIIKFASKTTNVWGSGTARADDELDPAAKYNAVRGPLTRQMVLRSGGACPEVFGDPGLLLPRFYTPKPAEKRINVGLIRHLQDRNQVIKLDGVHEISIIRVGHREIEEFVDEICACDLILSSTLHGIITAQAYGVPVRWCKFSANATAIPGDGIKFEDYFRSVGMPIQTPLDLSAVKVIDESLAQDIDRTVDLQFDADALIEAFPH